MSFAKEVGLSESELQHAHPKLRDRILETYAKVKGLGLLQAQEMFQRDSKRLDARARAVYAKLGLPVKAMSDDDETVLGDKITQNSGALAAAILGGSVVVASAMWGLTRKPDEPQPEPPAVQDTDTTSTVRPT